MGVSLLSFEPWPSLEDTLPVILGNTEIAYTLWMPGTWTWNLDLDLEPGPWTWNLDLVFFQAF